MILDIPIFRRQSSHAECAPPLFGTFPIMKMVRASHGVRWDVLKAQLKVFHGQSGMRALSSRCEPLVPPEAGDGHRTAGIELESTAGGQRGWEFRQAWVRSTATGTKAWQSKAPAIEPIDIEQVQDIKQ